MLYILMWILLIVAVIARCSVTSSPTNRLSEGRSLYAMEWWIRVSRPPPREDPGRSRLTAAYPGKSLRVEEGHNLVSWTQATRTPLSCRRADNSWWEFWMPLQLNCRMEPSPGGLLLNGAPTLPGEGGGDGVGEGEGVGEGDGVGEPPSPAEGTVEVESTESVGEGGRAGG